MGQSTSPFAGVKLSEQTRPISPGLDQRLFSSPPPSNPVALQPERPTVNQETRKPGTQEPGKQVNQETRKSGNPEPSKPVSQETRNPGTLSATPTALPAEDSTRELDLSKTPLYKATFLFTQEELDALEDLKLTLRRKYDVKSSKNDLMRCALHGLVENSHHEPEFGDLLKHLRARTSR